MAEEPKAGPSSRKRPGENLGNGCNFGTSKEPMEMEELRATTDNELNIQKKMEKFDSNAELEIVSEKSKVKYSKKYSLSLQ